jgi:transcription-repair coupling factor (superfamily II helicase)
MKIAMRDMEIRGVGTIFGLEQHGFINDVGLNYYLEMLNDTVMESKGLMLNKVDTEVEGIVGSIVIPEFYIYDPFERMRFYRRIASATTIGELEDIGSELEDRFGKLPESVTNLLDNAMLRIFLWNHGVKRATISDLGLVVEFKNGYLEKFSEKYIYNEKENSYMFFLNIDDLVEGLKRVQQV